MGGFDWALSVILEHEGGYVNDPRDPGGETNMGISKRAYPHLDIHSLTRDQVAEIYRRDYWDKLSCDKLNWSVALCVFDAGVNSGIGRAAKWLQQALNACGKGVATDGMIGPQTILAATLCDPRDVIEAFSGIRKSFLRNSLNYLLYGKGWTARVNDTYRQACAYLDNEGALA